MSNRRPNRPRKWFQPLPNQRPNRRRRSIPMRRRPLRQRKRPPLPRPRLRLTAWVCCASAIANRCGRGILICSCSAWWLRRQGRTMSYGCRMRRGMRSIWGRFRWRPKSPTRAARPRTCWASMAVASSVSSRMERVMARLGRLPIAARFRPVRCSMCATSSTSLPTIRAPGLFAGRGEPAYPGD